LYQLMPRILPLLFFNLLIGAHVFSQQSLSVDSLESSNRWGISIDPTSLINYAGNITSGINEVPVWAGNQEDQINIFCLKDKTKNKFLRYGIGLSIHSSRSKELVQALDGNSDPIKGTFVEDITEENSLKFGLYLSKENWVGEHRLKGRYGYFSRLNIALESFNVLSENPLESLIGDTLFYSPGRTFEFQTGVILGASYFVTKTIFISGDSDISFRFRDTRNSVLRQVEFDPVTSSEPFISNVEGAAKSNSIDLGVRFRPTLRLTFLF